MIANVSKEAGKIEQAEIMVDTAYAAPLLGC